MMKPTTRDIYFIYFYYAHYKNAAIAFKYQPLPLIAANTAALTFCYWEAFNFKISDDLFH